MAAPTPYDRQYNFSNYQAAQPSDPLPGNKVDQELNAVKNSLDETQTNLALIQRDDGQLKNNSVGLDQLKAEVEIGVNPPTAWVTAQNYLVTETVTFEAGFYRCEENHISGVFATDLAAGKWELIVDFGDAISETAIEEALHEADNKTEPVDDDEFMGNDSADSYTLRRFKWSNLKTYMVAGIGAILATLTAKTTLVDADNILIGDSAAANATKRVTISDFKTTLLGGLGAVIAALTGKTTPVDGDTLLLSDSAASNASKKLTWANMKTTFFGSIGSLLASATSKTTPADADSVLLSDSAASDATKKVTIANLRAAIGASSNSNDAYFAFKIADLEGVRLNMAGGIADAYDSETDVDTATSANESYDAAGDKYSSSVTAGAAAFPTNMTGASAPSPYVASSTTVFSIQAPYLVFDGNAGTYWQTTTPGANEMLQLDLGASGALPIYSYSLSSLAAAPTAMVSAWTFEGSNNGSTWTVLDTRTAQTGWGAPETRTFTVASPGAAYRYYRLNITAGNTAGNYLIASFTALRATINNMTLVSNAFAATAVPTVARVACFIDPQDSITMNTDFTAEVSRDGGTTWTAVTLALVSNPVGAVEQYEGSVSISAQPSGSSMKYRLKTLNNKAIEVTGIVFQWS